MEKVLTDVGYRMPNQGKQKKRVVEKLFRGDYEPLFDLCKKYDAFQDMPFSQGVTYAILDAVFPGSRFILTVRDSDAWFESLVRFSLKVLLKKAGVENINDFSESTLKDKAIYLHKNYLYNTFKSHAASVVDHRICFDWSLVYDKKHRVEIYEKRNQEIILYFRERQDQLLVIDISKEEDNSKIVEFLGLPKELIAPLPHLNRSL